MQIADRCMVTVHFTLTNEQGTPITSTLPDKPLIYLHGAGGIARGLEQVLTGSQAGDAFKMTIALEDGFGARDESLVQTVSRTLLGASAEPVIGARLLAQTARGPLNVVVTAIDNDAVTVDGNHPLAGRPFYADVHVVDVRLATPQELQTGA